jgi:hypothetical protein
MLSFIAHVSIRGKFLVSSTSVLLTFILMRAVNDIMNLILPQGLAKLCSKIQIGNTHHVFIYKKGMLPAKRPRPCHKLCMWPYIPKVQDEDPGITYRNPGERRMSYIIS